MSGGGLFRKRGWAQFVPVLVAGGREGRDAGVVLADAVREVGGGGDGEPGGRAGGGDADGRAAVVEMGRAEHAFSRELAIPVSVRFAAGVRLELPDGAGAGGAGGGRADGVEHFAGLVGRGRREDFRRWRGVSVAPGHGDRGLLRLCVLHAGVFRGSVPRAAAGGWAAEFRAGDESAVPESGCDPVRQVDPVRHRGLALDEGDDGIRDDGVLVCPAGAR